MMNKKAYCKPECFIAELLGGSLMITASGHVRLNSGGEGRAEEGMSRGDFWDETE
jgi:hypothetical protein